MFHLRITLIQRCVAAWLLSLSIHQAQAQTAEQWTEWGTALHGGFGSLIAYGIRVGHDALQRLNAEKRQLSVDYFDGPLAPCPCIIDGVSIAVAASLGQQTLHLSSKKTDLNLLGRVTFTHRITNASITYDLPIAALDLMQSINRDHPANQRYEAVLRLKNEQLFTVTDNTRAR
jgi:formylmethanofuran dehydrogenase subunit E